jgi:hypothetical protein
MNKDNIYALSWKKDKYNVIKEVDWWFTFHMIEYSIFSKLLFQIQIIRIYINENNSYDKCHLNTNVVS